MSKELEAFDELHCVACGMKKYDEKTVKAEIIVETALKEYEETDNQISQLFEKFGINGRTDLLKQLKALEIIKEKHVDCFKLIAIFRTSDNLEHYNQNYGRNWQLTIEEYYLLKGVLQ